MQPEKEICSEKMFEYNFVFSDGLDVFCRLPGEGGNPYS